MSNALCNHVGAICVIGNFWNCAECEAPRPNFRHLAKFPSFSQAIQFTVAVKEAEEVPGQVLVEMTVHDAMAAIMEHGLKPLDMSAIRLAKVEPDAGSTWGRSPDYGLPSKDKHAATIRAMYPKIQGTASDAVVVNFKTLKKRT